MDPSAPLWHQIAHPFLWYRAEDLPRLRHNTTLPFWEPKFATWRQELAGLDTLKIDADKIDFHQGTNKQALKAALCFVVSGEEHYGRLVASFLGAMARWYRHQPSWRVRMCDNSPGHWTGNQWGGISGNHIVDPQMWFSTAHLYDVVYGHGFLAPAEAETLEEMMALCHQVACLHEENLKLDNNRAAWLMGGSYLSTLFDRNPIRARLCRERYRNTMPRFLETILDDGVQYEIGPYGIATIAAMQIFARCVRGAEGHDFFREKVNGVGFEDAFRAWVQQLIPGSSLRVPLLKDRVNHWDAICAGYLEYGTPELGWAISRMGERNWVPMFQHWPQGFEFYTYREPRDFHPPRYRHSLLPSGGMALLRTSWDADASSIYFRYGFQGSSHGGGGDKLQIELTCNDEQLLGDGLNSEQGYDKNVVIVDGQAQEQCSGKLLYSQLEDDTEVQYVSALGGFGSLPQRDFVHDPRVELNYWCTQNEECFPGVARMRRTVALVGKDLFVLRDTLWSLDEQEHDYQWLFHTFARVTGIAQSLEETALTYTGRPNHHGQMIKTTVRPARYFQIEHPGRLALEADRASLGIHFVTHGATAPQRVALMEGSGRHAYAGSSETGDGMSRKPMTTLSLQARGTHVTMMTFLAPRAAGAAISSNVVETVEDADLDRARVVLTVAGRRRELLINENEVPWQVGGRGVPQGILLD